MNSDYDVTKLLPAISEIHSPALILIRGIPGSGKSTLASKLAAYFRTTEHYEADDWFTSWNSAQGKYVYQFKGEEIGQAHDYCQNKVAHALATHAPFVICSNTNKQMWEMQPYFDMAQTYTYNTTVINCRRHGQSIHNISQDKIDALRLKWEELPNA